MGYSQLHKYTLYVYIYICTYNYTYKHVQHTYKGTDSAKAMPSQRAAAVWSHIDWSSAATPAAAGHHEISICKWKKALTKWYPKFMADFLNFVWSHVDFWGTQFWECVAIPRTSKECVCVYPNDRNAFSEVAEVKVRNQRWGPAKLFITCIGTYIILYIYSIYMYICIYKMSFIYTYLCMPSSYRRLRVESGIYHPEKEHLGFIHPIFSQPAGPSNPNKLD